MLILNRPKDSRTAIQLFQHAIHCHFWQTFTPGFIWHINEKICQLSYLFHLSCCWCTAKTKYKKCKTNISRKGIAVPVSTFMFLWAIYIFPRSVCLLCCRKICGPFHKWNFRCSVCFLPTRRGGSTWRWMVILSSPTSFLAVQRYCPLSDT